MKLATKIALLGSALAFGVGMTYAVSRDLDLKDQAAPVAVAAPAPTPAPVAVEAPAPAPVEAPAPAPVEATYTYEEVMAEACEAGRQYKNDIGTGFITLSQARGEAKLYADDLSAQSARVGSEVIYDKIRECLW